MDRITNLRLKELPVRLSKPRKGLPENVNESHPQIVLLKAQHVQILAMTPRTTTPAPFSAGSKKKAGLKEISSKKTA